MDKDGFRNYLRKSGKSQGVTEATVAHVAEFESYLIGQRERSELEEALPEDLEAFIHWIEKDEDLAAKKYLLGIRYFYEFCPNEAVANLASFRWNERMADSRGPLRLKEFQRISESDLVKLKKAGITNTNELMKEGQTPARRKELSTKTGVPASIITELVKLSDLSRIQGVKGIRARLYYDAGIDTMDKMAKWNPAELRAHLIEFVRKTGFKGIAPLPKEVKNTVEMAKRMPRVVEY